MREMTTDVRIEPATNDRGRVRQFADDVRYYLTLDPRQLPSKYLYDALGSALFEAICHLPWYPLKRAELRLLQAHAREIFGRRFTTVLELGPGSGDKLSALLAAAGPRRELAVHIVDVSPSALAQATRALEQLPGVRVIAHEATYEHGLQRAAAMSGDGRSLTLLLGSNIGNFDPPGRDAFIRAIRASLATGDALLLGADLVKPERDLLLAYDDPLQVTAAFNRNLLVRINRELDGSFDLTGFDHRAVWNRRHSRMEMHLVSTRRQRIDIRAAGMVFVMEPGESIWTESSYKFDPGEIGPMLERCGFRLGAQWTEPADRFSLTLAEAV